LIWPGRPSAAESADGQSATEGGRKIEDPPNDAARLAWALRLCLTRHPSEQEVKQFQQLLEVARAYYEQHRDDAEALTSRHAAPGVTAAENAAWVATTRIMLNLDEFIVRD
jgi:hypothetical protein